MQICFHTLYKKKLLYCDFIFFYSAGQSGQLQQYEADLQYEEGYEDYGQYAAEVVMDEAQGHDASKGEKLHKNRVLDEVDFCFSDLFT